MKPSPRTLFQYCSPAEFHGIITSKRLWFTDLYSANDPREIQSGYKKFVSAIETLAGAESDESSKAYLHALAKRLGAFIGYVRAYCACFSTARDQLPMWTAYGAQHGGIAIGFRPTALKDIPAKMQLVRYVDETSDHDYRRVVSEAVRYINTRYPIDGIANLMKPNIEAFTLMTGQKHQSWAYEQEVRLVHAQTAVPPAADEHLLYTLTGILPNGQLVKWTPPLTRDSPTGIVRYLTFPFGRFRDGGYDPTKAIREIIVGPKCSMTPEDVEAAMIANGFQDFVVASSDCQIR